MPQDCVPLTDPATLDAMRATLQMPYNTEHYALNGAVSLRTAYQGQLWTYLAARLGPNINGELQHVGIWAQPDGQPPQGLHLSIETDGDDGFDLEVDNDTVFTAAAPTGPFYWNNDKTRVGACALGAAGATTSKTRMTLADYQQLTPQRTTLKALHALVGQDACEQSSESSIGGTVTLGLTCRGDGDAGANAVLIFQDGILVSKAQAGLR